MVNRTKQTDRQLPSNAASRSAIDSSTTVESAVIPIEKGGIFQEKQFYWTELQEQILLGGYWAGYIFTQVPGK